MRDTFKEVCYFRDRREAICELLSFEGHPRSVRILSWDLADPFPPEKLRGQMDPGEETHNFERIISFLTSSEDLNVVLITRPLEMLGNLDYKLPLIKFLYGRGVRIYYNSKVHAKAIIADRRGEQVLYLSSANLTYTGVNVKHELGVIIRREGGRFDRISDYINKKIISDPLTKQEDGTFYVGAVASYHHNMVPEEW